MTLPLLRAKRKKFKTTSRHIQCDLLHQYGTSSQITRQDLRKGDHDHLIQVTDYFRSVLQYLLREMISGTLINDRLIEGDRLKEVIHALTKIKCSTLSHCKANVKNRNKLFRAMMLTKQSEQSAMNGCYGELTLYM